MLVLNLWPCYLDFLVAGITSLNKQAWLLIIFDGLTFCSHLLRGIKLLFPTSHQHMHRVRGQLQQLCFDYGRQTLNIQHILLYLFPHKEKQKNFIMDIGVMDQFQSLQAFGCMNLILFISFGLDIQEYLYFMKIAAVMTFYSQLFQNSSVAMMPLWNLSNSALLYYATWQPKFKCPLGSIKFLP